MDNTIMNDDDDKLEREELIGCVMGDLDLTDAEWESIPPAVQEKILRKFRDLYDRL